LVNESKKKEDQGMIESREDTERGERGERR
jgi:hypothetical protein